MEDISKIWPKWELVEILGQGGFGTVYKAKRESFDKSSYSAIKIIKIPQDHSEINDMTSSGLTKEQIKDYYQKNVKSLVNEIRLMENLKSASNIVGIEDFEVVEREDEFGWIIYIRMELLTNLSNYMNLHPMTIKDVIKLGIDICTALEYCHKENIIHRDIKPGNIFASKFGDFKLGDFGVSKEIEQANATMSLKGTKSYMAPEMVRMENYDKSVDLYALGLTMYELLNHNRMPFLPTYPNPFFANDREQATLKRLSGEQFPMIEEIGELNDVLQKACAFLPKDRFKNATEMRLALSNIQLKENKIISEVTTKVNDNEKSGDFKGGFLFDDDKEIKGKSDSDKTIGAFTDVSGIFKDVEIEKTIVHEKVDYVIDCEKCHDKASIIFTNGYYCGKHITLSKKDDQTRQLAEMFEKSLSSKNTKYYLKKMIEIDDCAYLHHRLGKEYLNGGSKKYAKEEFNKAYLKDSNDIAICKDKALVCIEEKKYSEGLEIINKAESLMTDSTNHYLIMIIYATKAILLHKSKIHNEALNYIIKAHLLNTDYRCDWHYCGSEYLLTEAAILEFLYQKDDYLRAKDDDIHHNLMRIVCFYGIGKTLFKDIFEKMRKQNKVTAYGTKIPDFYFLKNEIGYSRKNTLSKTFYIGNYGIYVFSSMFTYGLTYISYFELTQQLMLSTQSNDLIISARKNKNNLKFTINKPHLQWIFDSLKEIHKYNKGVK